MEPDRIVIDPAPDPGKNTWHSLEISRRLDEMTATGWPVLMAASRKDFVGEPRCRRRGPARGHLAVTALDARIFRAHDVRPTRQALEMVTVIEGQGGAVKR